MCGLQRGPGGAGGGLATAIGPELGATDATRCRGRGCNRHRERGGRRHHRRRQRGRRHHRGDGAARDLTGVDPNRGGQRRRHVTRRRQRPEGGRPDGALHEAHDLGAQRDDEFAALRLRLFAVAADGVGDVGVVAGDRNARKQDDIARPCRDIGFDIAARSLRELEFGAECRERREAQQLADGEVDVGEDDALALDAEQRELEAGAQGLGLDRHLVEVVADVGADLGDIGVVSGDLQRTARARHHPDAGLGDHAHRPLGAQEIQQDLGVEVRPREHGTDAEIALADRSDGAVGCTEGREHIARGRRLGAAGATTATPAATAAAAAATGRVADDGIFGPAEAIPVDAALGVVGEIDLVDMDFVDEHRACSAHLADILLDGAQRGAVRAEDDGAVEAVEVGVTRAQHLQVVGEPGQVVLGQRRRCLQHELLLGRDDEHAVAHAVEEAHSLGELLHDLGERAGDTEHSRRTVTLEAARAAFDGEREVRAGGDEIHRVEKTALGDADIAQADVGQRIAVFDAAQQEFDICGRLDRQIDFGDVEDVGGGTQPLDRVGQVRVAGDPRERLTGGEERGRASQYDDANAPDPARDGRSFCGNGIPLR